MAKLLIQNRSININAQSNQPVYREIQKRDRRNRIVFRYLGREIVRLYDRCYVYCDDNSLVRNDEGFPILFTTDWRLFEDFRYEFLREAYDGMKEKIRTSSTQKNTALHIACQVGARDIVKILLTHPDVKTDVSNREGKIPMDFIARGFERIIKSEFEEAQKGKQLLNALFLGNAEQAKILLNEELNSNCWKRNVIEEIETPFILIIKSCFREITEDKKEVLTKLLKHKNLDFSQVRPIQAIPQLKQIITQALTERLATAINGKDLDDVKKLVEDNSFMNRAIVIAALVNIDDPFSSIKNYLSRKFPTSTEQFLVNAYSVIPRISSELISQELQQREDFRNELERTKFQLREKEQKLDRLLCERMRDTNKILQLERNLMQVSEEKNRISSKNLRLHIKSLNTLKVSNQIKKQNNCAYASFIFFGVSLTITAFASSLEIRGLFTLASFLSFVIGCIYSGEVDTSLSDVKSVQLSNYVELE